MITQAEVGKIKAGHMLWNVVLNADMKPMIEPVLVVRTESHRTITRFYTWLCIGLLVDGRETFTTRQHLVNLPSLFVSKSKAKKWAAYVRKVCFQSFGYMNLGPVLPWYGSETSVAYTQLSVWRNSKMLEFLLEGWQLQSTYNPKTQQYDSIRSFGASILLPYTDVAQVPNEVKLGKGTLNLAEDNAKTKLEAVKWNRCKQAFNPSLDDNLLCPIPAPKVLGDVNELAFCSVLNLIFPFIA